MLAPASVIVHVLLLLWVSLKFPLSPKCATLICAVCPSALLISSSFPASSILLLHQVPELRADLSHLGSVGGCDGGAGSAPSAHQNALQQPLSGGERSKRLTVAAVGVVGGGGGLGGRSL